MWQVRTLRWCRAASADPSFRRDRDALATVFWAPVRRCFRRDGLGGLGRRRRFRQMEFLPAVVEGQPGSLGWGGGGTVRSDDSQPGRRNMTNSAPAVRSCNPTPTTRKTGRVASRSTIHAKFWPKNPCRQLPRSDQRRPRHPPVHRLQPTEWGHEAALTIIATIFLPMSFLTGCGWPPAWPGVIGRPLEQGTHIVAVRLQGPAPVARQKRHRCLLVFWKHERSLTVADHLAG